MSSYAAPDPSAPLGAAFTAQNAAAAQSFAKDTAQEVKQNIHDGDWSLRLLALLGGLAMIAVSILGFIGHIVMLHWFSALFNVYVFILGILIVVLESGRRFAVFARLESDLYRNALFLKYIWGRGIVYFIAGSIQISLRDLVDVVVGLCVCAVGIMYIFIGRRASKKLEALRKSGDCTPAQMQEQFAIADTDGQGSLTQAQFKVMSDCLGMGLNPRETEAAFLYLDRSHTGRLTYESIQMWWGTESGTGTPTSPVTMCY